MKHTVRAFSVGLITAGIILLGVHLIIGNDDVQAEIPTDELIAQIEADGYRVITEEEYITFSVASSKKTDEEEKVENHTDDDAEKQEKETDAKEDGKDEIDEDAEEKATKKDKDKNKEKDNNKDEDKNKAEDEDDDKENDESKDKDKNDDKEKDKKKQTPKTITVTIESGMASSEISNMLEQLGIIEDAREFSNYLIEHEYHTRVQMGEHELKSGMSYYEIAEAISR